MAFENHLKEQRARLGVNQEEMGKLIGVSRQTISQIERGVYSPSVETAFKISEVCGVPVEEIFGTQDAGNNSSENSSASAGTMENTFDGEFDGNTLHPLFTKIDFK